MISRAKVAWKVQWFVQEVEEAPPSVACMYKVIGGEKEKIHVRSYLKCVECLANVDIRAIYVLTVTPTLSIVSFRRYTLMPLIYHSGIENALSEMGSSLDV